MVVGGVSVPAYITGHMTRGVSVRGGFCPGGVSVGGGISVQGVSVSETPCTIMSGRYAFLFK